MAVAGNMDSPEVEAAMGGAARLIDGRGFVLEGAGFFGVSAAPPSPLHTPYEISEEEILKRAEAGWKDVAGAVRRIFVPHAPPENTKLDVLRTGAHVGSSSIRRFIEERQPDAVLCGHIHEARGLDRLGTTQMMNCGPAHRGCYGILLIGSEMVMECKGGE
jgi:Icc-related predicted phosphoesterase